MIRTLTEPIQEPFWSAGQKYGWEGSRTGIGLNVLHYQNLADSDFLRVKVILAKKERPYEIQVGNIRSIERMYQPYMVVKKVNLVILPLQEFKCLEEYVPPAPMDPVNPVEVKVEEDKQIKLF